MSEVADDIERIAGLNNDLLRDVAVSRMEKGSISRELLSKVVGDDQVSLKDEEEVLESLREGSRERLK